VHKDKSPPFSSVNSVAFLVFLVHKGAFIAEIFETRKTLCVGRGPAATQPGCDLFAGAHTAHSRNPPTVSVGSAASFRIDRKTCSKTGLAYPPKANPAHSKASHCDGLNFVGCHDLWYQVCETILAFLSGHRNSSTRPAHLASEWRSALVSGGRARSCTRLASTPVFAISRLWHGVLQPRAAVDRSGSSFCLQRP
jgi:hypothetical protein